MDSIKISKIGFNPSKYPGVSVVKFDLENLTLIVGPNNSGKSSVLSNIQQFSYGEQVDDILNSISLTVPTKPDELIALFKKFNTAKNNDFKNFGMYRPIIQSEEQKNKIQSRTIDLHTSIPNLIRQQTFGPLLAYFVLKLSGKFRFQLLNSQTTGDPLQPDNILSVLLHDNVKREQFRNAIFNEFNWNVFFVERDGAINIRVSQDSWPIQDENPRSAKYLKFLETTIPLERLGDGIQSFVGLFLAIYAMDCPVLLIDEPEAYLHPPNAYSMGKKLTQISESRGGNLIASTHDSDFLLGCLEQTDSVTIIRMTYENNSGNVKQLEKSDVLEFIKNPLLRSTGTLDALFHKSAIISEGDSDRIFYNAINRRLERTQNQIDDALFLRGLGKGTLHKMVNSLRKLGIPAACVYDLDIIRKNDQSADFFKNYLSSMNYPSAKLDSIENERKFVEDKLEKLDSTGKGKGFKKIGISGLNASAKKRSLTFLKNLGEYGIFVCPNGSLESWLTSLGIPSGNDTKKKWLISMLEKLGYDKDPESLDPSDDDVWKFLDDIKNWIDNSERNGMP